MDRKRSWVLVLWLLGMLFPVGWLGNISPRFEAILSTVFSPEWVHWLMHAALFASLAVFLIWVFELTISRRTLGLIILAGFLVGLIQEWLQLLAGVQVLGWNTFFDLCVDSLGLLIGFGIAAIGNRKRRPEQDSARR
jgi:glycopeptide antibiotics resistance protein